MKIIKSQNGFTLIELLILIVIFSIFLGAILPMVIENISLNNAAKTKLIAYQTAQSKTEELRNSDFDSLASGSFSVNLTLHAGSGSVQISKDINGDGTNEEDIVKATVTVSYEVREETQNVAITTYIARTGIGK